MYKNLTLNDIMTTPVVTIEQSCTASDGIAIMREQRISSLVVTEQQAPIGMFTERDVVRLAEAHRSPGSIQLQQTINRPLISAPSNMDYRDGYRLITQHRVRHLVVTKNHNLAGIVSESDFLKHLGSEFLLRFKDVASVMNPEVETLTTQNSIDDAIHRMSSNEASCVVVEQAGKPVGIFTERDLVSRELLNSDQSNQALSEAMSSPVKTITEDTLLPDAILIMADLKVRRLVVVNDSGNIVGMLTHHDVVQQLYDRQIEQLLNALTLREKELSETRTELDLERQLRQTEQRLALVLNTLPYGIQECDTDGVIIFSNHAHHRLLGASEGELVGRKVWELAETQQKADELEYFFSSLITDQPAPEPYTESHTRADGQEIILVYIWDYQRDSNGQLTGITWVISDITDQRKAEQSLLNRQTELEQIFQALPMGLVYADSARRIVKTNPAFTQIFGYEHEEVLRQKTEVLYARSEDYIEQGVQRFNPSSKGSMTPYEIEYKRKNGELFWSKTVGTPVRDSNGKTVGMLGLVQDITDAKQAEERRRLSDKVMSNTSEGIAITDANAVIIEVNEAFTKITGYGREEVIGQNPRLLKSGHHDRDFYYAMWQSLLTTGQWQGEIWNRNKNGSVYPEWQNINAVFNDVGQITHYVAVFSDISRIKNSQEKLDRLAHYDALTELPNRLMLNARLEQALNHAERNNQLLGVMVIDLDRFKHINDSLGHPVGDQLLQKVAQILQQVVRKSDCIARIGGDEFVVLLEELDQLETLSSLAQKVLTAFDTPFLISQHEIGITVSLGISVFPNDGSDATILLRNADSAMYHAKQEGRNTYRFYTEELTTKALARVVLENYLREAVSKQDLNLHFQPQFDFETGRVIGVEALLRWFHPNLGSVSPAEFIPVAEDSGLIFPIGEWVLQQACRQAKAWLDSGLSFGQVAVNVAGLQIQRGTLIGQVKQILAETSLPAQCLELEITESFIMTHASFAIEQLNELRSLGVKLSIDDFGTGYSSLSYLKQLPIDKLKIDQSFVHDLPDDNHSNAIAQAIVALGKSLELTVIAEGVETQAQAEFLSSIGCEQAQGFFYARPGPADQLDQAFGKAIT